VRLPGSVSIREVGPRDGFQNEPEVIATADKVRLSSANAASASSSPIATGPFAVPSLV